jgi:hypothetical protein
VWGVVSNSSRVFLLVLGASFTASGCRAERPPGDAFGASAESRALVAELRALPVRTDPRDRAVDELGRRFEALYRSRPRAAEAAPAVVRDERELRGKIVLDALSRADTVESAAALAAVVTDRAAPAGARRYALERLSTWGDDLILPRAGEIADDSTRGVARR